MITMSRKNDNGISLATPPAIHVGPIITPGSNETISIVIPLSAQLATVSGQKVENNCKDCPKDGKPQQLQHQHQHQQQHQHQHQNQHQHQHQQHQHQHHQQQQHQHHQQQQQQQQQQHHQHQPQQQQQHQHQPQPQQQQPSQQQSASGNTPRPRRDKTKGCPFPTCTRYGRAFSRAHDLKRHIIRHEMRKEKLSDLARQQIRGEFVEASQAILQRDGQCLIKLEDLREADLKLYSCPRCKKKFSSDIKLRSHLITHEKNQGEAQSHVRQHTVDMQQGQTVVVKSEQKDLADKDDDFLLEEMLLLNKNPRRTVSSDKGNIGGSKIRCDYCSKTFKTKWTLSSHVAAHEGRFQFDCAQCGKKFVRKSHYEGHVRSHEAARPYVCEQCGKTFKELKHRREHTKRKHSGNQNAIQNLLDSIGPCASDDVPVADQAKFTLLMPVNFTT